MCQWSKQINMQNVNQDNTEPNDDDWMSFTEMMIGRCTKQAHSRLHTWSDWYNGRYQCWCLPKNLGQNYILEWLISNELIIHLFLTFQSHENPFKFRILDDASFAIFKRYRQYWLCTRLDWDWNQIVFMILLIYLVAISAIPTPVSHTPQPDSLEPIVIL